MRPRILCAMSAIWLAVASAPVPAAACVDIPPVPPAHVLAGFRAPTATYGPGHRGIDLAVTPGSAVRAPIAGLVTFAGQVAGRGVLTISDGIRVVTMEPVTSSLPAGSQVVVGQRVAVVGTGGHCSDCLHLGLRVAGKYVSPLRLHAVLVP